MKKGRRYIEPMLGTGDKKGTNIKDVKKIANLLLEKDLHGSLKNGPNTGPDDIMSLDSQGDYTRDRSPGAYTGGGRGEPHRMHAGVAPPFSRCPSAHVF